MRVDNLFSGGIEIAVFVGLDDVGLAETLADTEEKVVFRIQWWGVECKEVGFGGLFSKNVVSGCSFLGGLPFVLACY